MRPSHSAPRGGKSSAGHRTPQVVLRLSVAAGKLRTGELQNGFHLSSGHTLRQKTPGDPQVHNAPIRPRETLPNMPSLQTVLIDRDGFGGGDRGHEVAVRVGCICRRPAWSPAIPRGLYQRIRVGRQARTGMYDLHPGSEPAGDPPARLLIGEPGESAKVMPIRAGRIPSVTVRQLSGHYGGNAGFQPRGRDSDPSLQMPGTGLKDQTG
jgi:hypothetical protein